MSVPRSVLNALAAPEIANLDPSHANPQIQFFPMSPQNKRSKAVPGKDNSEDGNQESLRSLPATSQCPDMSQWPGITRLIPKRAWLSSTWGSRAAASARIRAPLRARRRKRAPSSETLYEESDSDETSTRLSPPPSTPAPLAIRPQFPARDAGTAQSDNNYPLEMEIGPSMTSPRASGVAGLPDTSMEPTYPSKLFPWRTASFDLSMFQSVKRSCDDSGYSSLSLSELNVELEIGKEPTCCYSLKN